MGLGSVLNTALIGLGYNQRQLDVTAGNIANADTVGYTRKSLTASVSYDGNGRVTGLDADSMRRYLDLAVQTQYRTSLAQNNFASVSQQYTARLDTLFGTIQDSGSLPNQVNSFISSMSNLVSGPEDYSNRLEALRTAEAMVGKINAMSQEIQDMRQEVEYQISDQVNRVNELLTDLQALDREVVANSQDGDMPVGLMDQRDMILEELSGYIDITVKPTEQGGVRVHMGGGTLLYDVDVMKLKFDVRGNINANSLYSINPADRDVGTLVLENSEGSQIDLLATRTLRTGSLAGLVTMRDQTLTDAQTQLDELAASVARAFSTHVQDGTPYPATHIGAYGAVPSAGAALEKLAAAFDRWLSVWRRVGFEPVRHGWLNRARGKGEVMTARLGKRTLVGKFLDLDPHGALVLQSDDGATHTVSAGEVFFGEASHASDN